VQAANTQSRRLMAARAPSWFERVVVAPSGLIWPLVPIEVTGCGTGASLL
jgi:hypothetical protein